MKQFLLLFLMFFGYIVLAQQNEMMNFIRSDFEKLKEGNPLLTDAKLVIIEKGAIAASRDGTITFGIDQLNKIFSSFTDNPEMLKLAIRLVIAHELGHLMQFATYQNRPELNNDLLSRTLLEAQADIIGGSLWMTMFAQETQIDKKHQDLKADDLYLLFSLVLEIGIDENTVGTHPSKVDRLMCVQTGIQFGDLVFNEYILSEVDTKLAQGKQQEVYKLISPEYLENFRNLVNSISIRLDKGENEYRMDWTYRNAKKITNFHPDISKQIVLYHSENSNNEIKWDTSDESPTVDYEFSYLNMDLKHIDSLEMEKIILHKKRNSNIHKAVLQPGKLEKISGRLNWDKLDGDFLSQSALLKEEIPRLVFPSIGNSSIYLCQYYGVKPKLITSESVSSLRSFPNNINTTVYDAASRLDAIVTAFKYNIESLKIGIGEMYKITDSNIFSNHNSSISLGENNKTYIRTDYIFEPSTKVFESYKNTIIITNNQISSIEADKNFDFFLKATSIAFTDYNQVSKHNGNTVIFTNNEINIEVYKTPSTEDGVKNWIVGINIY